MVQDAPVLVRGIRGAGHLLIAPLHVEPGMGALGHLAVEGAAGAAARRGGQKAISAANEELAAAVRRTLSPDAGRAAANENAARAISDRQRRTWWRSSVGAAPAACLRL